MTSTNWHVFTTQCLRQDKAVSELRDAGLEVVRLMAFETRRAHRRTKRRVLDLRKPYPALGAYVFVNIQEPSDFVMAQSCHASRLPWAGGYAPRLSQKGVQFITRPPRELFPDTAIPTLQAIQEDNPDHGYIAGDDVTLYGCGFDGYEGTVKRVKEGGRIVVELERGLFEIEAPASALAERAA